MCEVFTSYRQQREAHRDPTARILGSRLKGIRYVNNGFGKGKLSEQMTSGYPQEAMFN
jgi:hypothetical protein